MRVSRCLATVILGAFLSTLATGADEPPLQQPPAAKPNIKVIGIARAGAKAAATVPTASLGDLLVISTEKELLPAYLDYATEQKKQVTLFLNGNDTGVLPKAVDREAGTLHFRLERNASDSQNKRIWSELLRNPFLTDDPQVDASIGLAGGVAEPSRSTFQLVVVKRSWAWLWTLLLVPVLLAFGWLAMKRDLLRDGPKPAPYSLGRCQMAWWFLLILIGYVFIWLISGDRDAITESLLVLMGISAGTGLGAVLINEDGGTAALTRAASEQLALQVAQQNTQAKVTAATTAIETAAAEGQADAIALKQLIDARAELAALDAQLLQARSVLNNAVAAPQSNGFVRDLLRDGEGKVGLHRFQIVVWTFVLGVIFVSSVLIELSMPTFSPTLLTLMGISAGTYLGFKFPEK
jgi:hypothetical protein